MEMDSEKGKENSSEESCVKQQAHLTNIDQIQSATIKIDQVPTQSTNIHSVAFNNAQVPVPVITQVQLCDTSDTKSVCIEPQAPPAETSKTVDAQAVTKHSQVQPSQISEMNHQALIQPSDACGDIPKTEKIATFQKSCQTEDAVHGSRMKNKSSTRLVQSQSHLTMNVTSFNLDNQKQKNAEKKHHLNKSATDSSRIGNSNLRAAAEKCDCNSVSDDFVYIKVPDDVEGMDQASNTNDRYPVQENNVVEHTDNDSNSSIEIISEQDHEYEDKIGAANDVHHGPENTESENNDEETKPDIAEDNKSSHEQSFKQDELLSSEEQSNEIAKADMETKEISPADGIIITLENDVTEKTHVEGYVPIKPPEVNEDTITSMNDLHQNQENNEIKIAKEQTTPEKNYDNKSLNYKKIEQDVSQSSGKPDAGHMEENGISPSDRNRMTLDKGATVKSDVDNKHTSAESCASNRSSKYKLVKVANTWFLEYGDNKILLPIPGDEHFEFYNGGIFGNNKGYEIQIAKDGQVNITPFRCAVVSNSLDTSNNQIAAGNMVDNQEFTTNVSKNVSITCVTNNESLHQWRNNNNVNHSSNNIGTDHNTFDSTFDNNYTPKGPMACDQSIDQLADGIENLKLSVVEHSSSPINSEETVCATTMPATTKFNNQDQETKPLQSSRSVGVVTEKGERPFMVKILVHTNEKSFNEPFPLEFQDYMKYQFVFNNSVTFNAIATEYKNKLSGDLKRGADCITVHLQTSNEPDVKAVQEKTIKHILQHSDNLVVKPWLATGIEGYKVATEIDKSEKLKVIEKYVEFMPDKNCIYAVFSKKSELIINQVFTEQTPKPFDINADKPVTRKFPLDLYDIFHSQSFSTSFKESFKNVQLDIKRLPAENKILITLRSPAKELNAALQTLKEESEKYSYDKIRFEEILNIEHFNNVGKLVETFLLQKLQGKNNVHWKIDSDAKIVGVWCLCKSETVKIIEAIKKMITVKRYFLGCISENNKIEMKSKSGDYLQVVFDDNTVNIYGCNDYFSEVLDFLQQMQNCNGTASALYPRLLNKKVQRNEKIGQESLSIKVCDKNTLIFFQQSKKFNIFVKDLKLSVDHKSELTLKFTGYAKNLANCVEKINTVLIGISSEYLKVTITNATRVMIDENVKLLNESEDLYVEILEFKHDMEMPTQPTISSVNHHVWEFANGHQIQVVNIAAKHTFSSLLVGVKEATENEGARFAFLPNSSSHALVYFPKYVNGETKETESVDKIVQKMLQEAQSKGFCHISIDIGQNESKKMQKMKKRMLHELIVYCQNQGSPTTFLLCCPETESFEQWCTICTSGIPNGSEGMSNVEMESCKIGETCSHVQNYEVKFLIVGTSSMVEKSKEHLESVCRNGQKIERDVTTMGARPKDKANLHDAKNINVAAGGSSYYSNQASSSGNVSGHSFKKGPETVSKSYIENFGVQTTEKQKEAIDYFVIANGIPKHYKHLTLQNELKHHGKKVQQLIYLDGNESALLKFQNKKDAETFLKNFKSTKMVFKQVKGNLHSLRMIVHPHVIKTAKLKGCYDYLKTQLGNIEVELKEDGDTYLLLSQTSNQLQYALDIISAIVDENSSTPMKDTNNGSSSEVEGKSQTVKSPVQHSIDNVHSLVWDVLCIEKEAVIKKIKKEKGDIEYIDGNIKITLMMNEQSVFPEIKSFVESFSGKEMADIPVTSQQIDEVISMQKVKSLSALFEKIEMEMKLRKCFTYIKPKGIIVVYCGEYNDLQKLKHQINLAFGFVKITGRKRILKPVDNEKNSSSPVEDAITYTRDTLTQKNSISRRGCKNLKEYVTNGIKVLVYEANILDLSVDCIVNAANSKLEHGGGVAWAIANAAGHELLSDCENLIRQIDAVPVGTACTTRAGNLRYKFVIHTVGPRWSDYKPHTIENVNQCGRDLYLAIYSSFYEAEKKNMKVIALPAISAAIFAVPEELCAYQYAKATIEYSTKSAPTRLEEIHFVDIKYNIVKQIQDMFDKWLVLKNIPQNIVEKYASIVQVNRSVSNPYSGSLKETLPNIELKVDLQHENVCMPLSYEGQEKQFMYHFFGIENQTVMVYEANLLSRKTSAIVATIDSIGKGGTVADALRQKMDANEAYKSELQNKLKQHNLVSDVFSTGGFGSGFKYIIHSVLPLSEKQRTLEERKQVLLKTYRNIFQHIIQKDGITSIAQVLIGVGHTKEEIELSAEAFLESYLATCSETIKPISIHVIMENGNALEWGRAIFDKKVHELKALYSKEKPETQDANSNLSSLTLSKGESPNAYMKGKNNKDIEIDNCVICMEEPNNPTTLNCGHTFCSDCIQQQFKFKMICPSCGKVCGIIKGDQPHGTMKTYIRHSSYCAGYENCGQIEINYTFPSGIQGDNHPNPGKKYEGISRKAYLPNNKQGQKILKMLTVAFERKLVFTIGNSRTTGKDGVITWNDIHHKTDYHHGSQFGYPDPTYLDRVTEELKAKGITENDVPSKPYN